MRRTGNLIFTLLLMATALVSAGTAQAQDTPLDAMLDRYTDWHTVELNGKLENDRLPVSPSVRIFMEKGKRLQISLRAPFLGEVGRIDISNDSLLAYNKLKKVYCREPLGDILREAPARIEDLQSLLLARVFILNRGTLSPANADGITFSEEPDCWLALPVEQPLDGRVQYGFTIDDDGTLTALYATMPEAASELSLLVEYFYEKKKTVIDVAFNKSDRLTQATLTLNAPKWGATPMQPVKTGSGWRRTDVTGFIKTLNGK